MALTQVDAGLLNSTAQYTGFKNRIINGAMMIDQRNAGASVTPAASAYTLDRWRAAISQASKLSVQQSTVAPSGFANSLLVTSLSAYSVTASDVFSVQHRIEGYNTADLAWGTASAQSVTLSFWVRSSLTGTFGGVIGNSAATRNYPFTYSISAANTWEQKTVTISGDTTGTWLTDNSTGISLRFNLGSGSTFSGTAGAWTGTEVYSATGATSVVGTSGATFYITGVQLEKGSTATSFDYRPYGTELALCQRYAIKYSSANGPYYRYGFGEVVNSTELSFGIYFPVNMRTYPSMTTSGSFNVYSASGQTSSTGLTVDVNSHEPSGVAITANVASGLTAGRAGSLISANSTTTSILFSAEL